MIVYRYNHLDNKFLLFEINLYGKILENILKFKTVGPDLYRLKYSKVKPSNLTPSSVQPKYMLSASSLTKASVCAMPWLTVILLRVF